MAGDSGRLSAADVQTLQQELTASTPDPEDYAELLATIGSLSSSPLYKDSRAELLIDGPATYAHMLESIRNARASVWLETYIFADDRVGRDFADALIERRRAGVDVRVIFDSIGSLASEAEFFEGMRSAGVRLIEFHDVNPADGGNPLDANVRDHRKLLVVDGRVAYTGGINLSSTYSSSSSGPIDPDERLENGWRDTHAAIYGPAVAGFASVFRTNWNENRGEQPALDSTAAPPERAGDDVIAILAAEGGDDTESEIFHGYFEAMRVARSRIWITQAYFAPHERFLDSLKAAARRGVDVRVLVPGVSDSALVFHASRSRYDDLLAAGVKIYETQASFLHAKTAVIDGLWSTVGSSNLDYRSFLHNDEINAVVFGPDFARELERQFIEDLEQSRRIDPDQWRERGALQRVKEWLSWPLEYWL